jgi:hypothetical protein
MLAMLWPFCVFYSDMKSCLFSLRNPDVNGRTFMGCYSKYSQRCHSRPIGLAASHFLQEQSNLAATEQGRFHMAGRPPSETERHLSTTPLLRLKGHQIVVIICLEHAGSLYVKLDSATGVLCCSAAKRGRIRYSVEILYYLWFDIIAMIFLTSQLVCTT